MRGQDPTKQNIDVKSNFFKLERKRHLSLE